MIKYPGIPEPRVSVITTNWFRFDEDYYYHWREDGVTHRILIKEGFEYDGASIPLLAQIFVGKWDLGRGPPGIHDALYRCGGDPSRALFGIHKKETNHGLTGLYMKHEILVDGTWERRGHIWSRRESDKLFYRHMKQVKVRRWKRRAAYKSVRIAGRPHWRSP